ncbi:hypothetical protein Q7363_09035, partial [Glaesserella parasuis]|nr:hypothetical protein [Glaesserella parasuis]MDP0105466.1 hypothetical protein [Glaesserella parasuis]
DSIPNSEVKRSNADGSVGIPHVRVGHRRGFIKEKKPQVRDSLRFLFSVYISDLILRFYFFPKNVKLITFLIH